MRRRKLDSRLRLPFMLVVVRMFARYSKARDLSPLCLCPSYISLSATNVILSTQSYVSMCKAVLELNVMAMLCDHYPHDDVACTSATLE